MNREEALAKVGKQIQITEQLYRDVPAGTTGTVIHANLVHRWVDHEGEYAPVDLYEVVVAWDLPLPIMTTMGTSEYALLHELT